MSVVYEGDRLGGKQLNWFAWTIGLHGQSLLTARSFPLMLIRPPPSLGNSIVLVGSPSPWKITGGLGVIAIGLNHVFKIPTVNIVGTQKGLRVGAERIIQASQMTPGGTAKNSLLIEPFRAHLEKLSSFQVWLILPKVS